MTTITLRLHPSEVLNANQRMYWAAKARLTASLRARATIAWRQAGSPQLSRAQCVVTITYPDRRARDVENLAPTLKAIIDGLVHPYPSVRGLLPDDDDAHLVGPDKRPTSEPTRGQFTFTLRFTELPND